MELRKHQDWLQMSSKGRTPIKIWGDNDNPGKGVANAAWKGAKMVVFAAAAGLAIGLGVGAYNSASA